MSSKTVEYLLEREWSMGNGQCPDCCGVSRNWHGHPLHLTSASIGHKAGCALAAALLEMGQAPLMQGEFKSDLVYERYVTESGFLSTRPKTADGCPKLRAADKVWREKIDDMIFEFLTVPE